MNFIKNYFKDKKCKREAVARVAKAERELALREDLKLTNSNIRYLNASINTLKATSTYAKGADAKETREIRKNIKSNIYRQEKQLEEERLNREIFERELEKIEQG